MALIYLCEATGIIVAEMILLEPKSAFLTFFIVQSSKGNAK